MAEFERLDNINALRFTGLIEDWWMKFLSIQRTKANLNKWLDELEIKYYTGMLSTNTNTSRGRVKFIDNMERVKFDDDIFQETYENQIALLSDTDLTEARVLRNGLVAQLGEDQWQEVYREYDDFIKANPGFTLRQQRLAFMDTAVARDHLSFIDKAGRHWWPRTYADMWCRTRNAEVSSDILKSEMDAVDLDVVQISDHNTLTPFDKQFEGKYYSLFGRTPGLPRLPVRTPFHPNCKHREIPISSREDLPPLIRHNIKQNRRIKSFNADLTVADKKQMRQMAQYQEENRVA